ncbi:hypothetical protein LWI29_011152 [Acer saccharum]|uniref:Uncharacterized protein n=1 Tax=Acer saccharum TaxID=4024 RepID=A0AA39TDR1_ACESA|nr:hypothetical protein LWI29_011152 [Acer saccharum]
MLEGVNEVFNQVEIDGPCSAPDPPESTPGLEAPMKELRTELVKNDGIQVIVVTALGGAGKTTLVVIVTNYGFLPAELSNFSLLGSDTISNLKRIRLEHVSIPSFGVQVSNLQKITLVMCNVGQAFRNSKFQISDAFPNLLEFEIDNCNDLEKLPDGLCDK